MFKSIEKDPESKELEKEKKNLFPDDWSEDDDCDNDEWSKEWDDFDWDAPREDDEDDWVDWDDWENED